MTSTIVGLSTSVSNSAINIIRISGEKSLSIINEIFTGKQNLKPNEIKYGFIKYGNEIYDEVLVSFMKAPKSYTGEDVIEINCHGGKLITNKILNLILKLGATLAQPGEFTKRAFLNGKIDLTKAESIMDLINAKSSLELKCSLDQRVGKLYRKINLIKEKILNVLSRIEVIVDFEDELEDLNKQGIENEILNLRDEILNILKFKNQGMVIKNGIKTSIVGKPNVGKSSLLNYLCDYNKAIVTDVPGTTRDVIEEFVDFGGVILNLFDTAGIRESDDLVEQIGINKTFEKINESDLIFFMLDATKEIDDEDFKIYNLIENKNTIFLINKCENKIFNKEYLIDKFRICNENNVLEISVANKEGFENLCSLIKNKFCLNELTVLEDEDIILTNMRHVECLNNSLNSLNNSINSLNNSMPLDIISIDVREALTFIMKIIGEDVNESIVNNIFSKFCIGK